MKKKKMKLVTGPSLHDLKKAVEAAAIIENPKLPLKDEPFERQFEKGGKKRKNRGRFPR